MLVALAQFHRQRQACYQGCAEEKENERENCELQPDCGHEKPFGQETDPPALL